MSIRTRPSHGGERLRGRHHQGGVVVGQPNELKRAIEHQCLLAFESAVANFQFATSHSHTTAGSTHSRRLAVLRCSPTPLRRLGCRVAWLEGVGGTRRVTVPARCLVGRSANCALRPSDPRVSAEHATIIWTGEEWSIRDLGSRNGTFVNGTRVEVGGATPLRCGDIVSFGRSGGGWTLADAGPPVATARCVDEGTPGTVVAEDGLLALPSAQDPRVSVFEDPRGGWALETAQESRAAVDGDVLTVDGRVWMLHLPTALDQTVGTESPLALDELALSFAISRDEEHVEMSLRRAGRWDKLGARTHHYLLLLLARARLEDAARPDGHTGEHGWRYVEDVCRMLQIDDGRLNTEIYRARRELSAAGVPGARLVERRRSSRSLRIGTGSLVVAASG